MRIENIQQLNIGASKEIKIHIRPLKKPGPWISGQWHGPKRATVSQISCNTRKHACLRPLQAKAHPNIWSLDQAPEPYCIWSPSPAQLEKVKCQCPKLSGTQH